MIKDNKEVAQSVSAGPPMRQVLRLIPKYDLKSLFRLFFLSAEHWCRELGKMNAASAPGFSVQCVLVQITNVR